MLSSGVQEMCELAMSLGLLVSKSGSQPTPQYSPPCVIPSPESGLALGLASDKQSTVEVMLYDFGALIRRSLTASTCLSLNTGSGVLPIRTQLPCCESPSHRER